MYMGKWGLSLRIEPKNRRLAVAAGAAGTPGDDGGLPVRSMALASGKCGLSRSCPELQEWLQIGLEKCHIESHNGFSLTICVSHGRKIYECLA